MLSSLFTETPGAYTVRLVLGHKVLEKNEIAGCDRRGVGVINVTWGFVSDPNPSLGGTKWKKTW